MHLHIQLEVEKVRNLVQDDDKLVKKETNLIYIYDKDN